MTIRLQLAALLLVPAPGLAASPDSASDLIAVTYACAGDVEVPVMYVNPPEGQGYAVALIENRLVGMRHAMSASGARYRSGEGAGDYELWGKGDRATISTGPEDAGRIIHADCEARN